MTCGMETLLNNHLNKLIQQFKPVKYDYTTADDIDSSQNALTELAAENSEKGRNTQKPAE